MIQYNAQNQRWTIRNAYATYQFGLKDNQIHHICYVPNEEFDQLDLEPVMSRELQPEAEVSINDEQRIKNHGVSFIGCGASNRAVYQRYRINEDKGEGSQTLVVTSLDEESGLEIHNHYVAYKHSPAIARYVTLRNTSAAPIDVQHLGSYALHGMPFSASAQSIPGREVRIHSFPSSWCWEGQIRSLTAEEAGLFHKMSLGSWHVENTGSFSSKEYIPFFVIEEVGMRTCWSMQIEYSGSWRFEIAGPGPRGGGLHVQGGLGNYTYAHWSKKLMPGEAYTSIKATLSCVQGEIDDVLNAMHRHRASVQIKRSRADQHLPVIFNEWLSTQGMVNAQTVREHLDILKGTGVEVYAMDAGWYNPHDEQNWYLHAGDWDPHSSRFPEGIKAVADQIKEAGMIPGIWLEIEVAGDRSKSYSDRTPLFMKKGSAYVEDHFRRFLYFGSPETREYATQAVENLIEAGFRYFKIDYNVDCGLGCDNSGDSLGQGLVEHVRGYYGWLDSLRTKYPDLIIENCSSGGNRLDYGMLTHTDLCSITDQSDWHRLGAVFYGATKYIHPSQLGNWSIMKADSDERELIFSLINSMMGRMHISGEADKLPPDKRQRLMEALTFYKQWREVLADCQVYHHTPNASLQYTEGWLVLQMNNADATRIMLGAWRLKSDNGQYTVRMKGIDQQAAYSVTSFPGRVHKDVNGDHLLQGYELALDEAYSAVIYGFEKM